MPVDFDTPLYSLQNVRLTFGVHPVFTGLDLFVKKGDKTCLIGRNGSGKSTLLKVIAGVIEPDEGEKFIQPGTKIAYMAQESDFSDFKTLRDVVVAGLRDAADTYKADILIDKLGLAAEQDPKSASGGERKKAALAQALAGEPIFCCWTTRPTIWILRPLKSWKKRSRTLPAR